MIMFIIIEQKHSVTFPMGHQIFKKKILTLIKNSGKKTLPLKNIVSLNLNNINFPLLIKGHKSGKYQNDFFAS